MRAVFTPDFRRCPALRRSFSEWRMTCGFQPKHRDCFVGGLRTSMSILETSSGPIQSLVRFIQLTSMWGPQGSHCGGWGDTYRGCISANNHAVTMYKKATSTPTDCGRHYLEALPCFSDDIASEDFQSLSSSRPSSNCCNGNIHQTLVTTSHDQRRS